MDKLILPLFALIVAVLLWFLVGIIGVHFVSGVIEPATVLDRVYKPSSTSTGVDSKGRVSVYSETESFRVILQTTHGVHTISVPAEQWAQAHPGQPVAVLFRTFIGINDYSITSFQATAAGVEK